MKVYTLHVGDMANCTYIVENNGEGIIIDPAWDMDKIEKVLEDYKIKPVCVIFTHGHYDHITNAEQLLRKYNIKAYIQQGDLHMLSFPPELLNVYSGDKTELIIGLIVNFMHTPGHSQGSSCIRIENVVFTGDTLFPGACGRTDLPGSDPKEMRKSLKRLANLLPGTVVYCGHAYGVDNGSITTIGDEVKNNPFMNMDENSYFGDLI